MMTTEFVVMCTDERCRDQPARYKIAAEWMGGDFLELKTFGFANDECLLRVYLDAFRRHQEVTSLGEDVGPIHIYELQLESGDLRLPRARHKEEQVLAKLQEQGLIRV